MMKSPQTLSKVAECLYRNAHGTYFALLKVRGKQIKRSLKTEDSALARRRLSELRTKAQGLSGEERGMTFDHLAERWLAQKQSDLRPSSWNRLNLVVRALTPFFAGLPVRSIGQSQIEAWKIKRGAAVGPRSFNYDREVLRRLFEYARTSLRIILENPALEVKKRKVGKAKLVIPTKEQFHTLVAMMRKEPKAQESADFVEFLAYSGLRLGEAIKVCVEDVNFDSDSLLVTGGEQGTKNHEVRTIPLFQPLRALLERLIGEGTKNPSERLFNFGTVRKALETACKKGTLPNFGHHAMRHFFCSNAIEAGCDFKVIAGWLGHKDGGVLAAMTYGHLRNEHSTAMAKRMTFTLESTTKPL